MNKGDLIEALRKEIGLARNKAEAVVDVFFGAMTDTLVEGGRVEIRGLCSIYIRDYKAYVGRNPKTKEPVPIEPKKLPFFKCGKELKDRVDSKRPPQS